MTKNTEGIKALKTRKELKLPSVSEITVPYYIGQLRSYGEHTVKVMTISKGYAILTPIEDLQINKKLRFIAGKPMWKVDFIFGTIQRL